MKLEHPLSDIAELRAMGSRLQNIEESDLPRSEVQKLILEFLKASAKATVGIDLYRLNTWYRARVQKPHENIRDHLADLLYRRVPPLNFGRAHSPRRRTFYAGWNVPTALAETDVEPGDVVWIVHSRPKKDVEIPALVFGAFEQFYRSGRLPYPASGLRNILAELFRSTPADYIVRTAYVDSVLSKLLREQGSGKYFITSLLAELTTLGPQASAFLYPSVQASHSFNIAVSDKTFNDCFEVMAVEKYFVSDMLGPGLCLFSAIHRSHVFSTRGYINWFSQSMHKYSFSPEGGLQYSLDAVGWTVPASWRDCEESASAT